MKACIKGAAENVNMGDIDEVCLDFDRVLLATDGSEPAVLATQYAVTLAKTFNASLLAIFVDDGMEALSLPEERSAEVDWDGYPVSVKGLGIAQLMAERNGVGVEVRVIRGGIAKRIIKTADEWNADLIVMGDTGRTGLKRLGMGSIAETVMRASDVPVLVVKTD